MDASILSDPGLYAFLHSLDQELAESVRREGCPCGGRLHRGDYPRKPRGALVALGEEYERRLSWCCGACRHRRTPPSVRFLGRRVYLGAVVVLVTAVTSGASARRLSWLRERVGVDRRTLERWREWWLERFVASPFWKEARARFQPPVAPERLPASLLERFTMGGGDRDRLLATLRFVSPLSVSRP